MKLLSLFFLVTSMCGYADEIPNFNYVTRGIYRSGILTKTNIDNLLTYNIKSIISMKTNAEEIAIEEKFAAKHGIKFVNIPIQFLVYSKYNENQFWKVNYQILTMPKPLLVHCSKGSDRTGMAIAMYRKIFEHWEYDKLSEEMNAYGFSPFFWYWKLFIRSL